jgi:actin-related protein
MHDGCVQDWESIAAQWKWIYENKLHIDPRESPLLTTEQPWNPISHKQKALEVAFEELEVPIFSLVQEPLCAAFASQNATALVVNIGSSVTSVTPVIDGSIVTKAALHSRFAGDFVNVHILANLSAREINVVAPYQVKRKAILDPGQPSNALLQEFSGITDSFQSYQVTKVLTEFKETTSRVSDSPITNPSALPNVGRPFEFPDGFNLTFGTERLTTAEALFKPGQFPLNDIQMPEGALHGLSDLVYHSLTKIDAPQEVIMSLLNNTVLCGGTSLMNGLDSRLEKDLLRMFPNFATRVFRSQNAVDCKNLVWTGASILASLGTFDQMWVKKQEYEELGAELAEKRFK